MRNAEHGTPSALRGFETPPGALPVPSHCHLPAPARGWSPTFWMPASRLVDVSGGREGCPAHKGQAGLSHPRASHGSPRGVTGPRGRAAATRATAAHHPRRPPGLSKGTAGPGLSRPSIPSKCRHGYRICSHSLQENCSPPAAAGRLGGDTSASPRSRRRCGEPPAPPPCTPRAGEGRGLWSPGTATY